MSKLHSLDVPEAVDFVSTVEGIAELNRLKREEAENPKYIGGRSEVLQEISNRQKRILDLHVFSVIERTKIGKFICVVHNITWDNGDKIPKGAEVSSLSRDRLRFYIQIGGVIEVES